MNFNEEMELAKVVVSFIDAQYEAEVRVIHKNNEDRASIMLKAGNDKIRPMVYLPEEIRTCNYNDVTLDMIKDIATHTIKIACDAMATNQIPSTTALLDSIFADKEKLLTNVVFSIANREWNKDHDWVTTPLDGDLIYVYEIPVEMVAGMHSSIKICDCHLEPSGVTIEELHAAALKNTPKKLPGTFTDITDVIHIPYMNIPQDFMYVISNSTSVKGAGAIMYPEIQEKILEVLGEDHVIIPSSIHETIVLHLPAAMGIDEINAIVKDVNATVVDREEWLSDHVYKFVYGKLVSII